MNAQRLRKIIQTGLFIAMLVACQAGLGTLGNQILTGSVVNFILIAACVLVGWKSGLIVAIISPFFAQLCGIGPIAQLVPFIALGNMSLVAIYALVQKVKFNEIVTWIISVPTAAIVKFGVLYISIVEIVLPLLSLPEKKVAAMSAMFSLPQFITALIGGIIAMVTIPLISRALKKMKMF